MQVGVGKELHCSPRAVAVLDYQVPDDVILAELHGYVAGHVHGVDPAAAAQVHRCRTLNAELVDDALHPSQDQFADALKRQGSIFRHCDGLDFQHAFNLSPVSRSRRRQRILGCRASVPVIGLRLIDRAELQRTAFRYNQLYAVRQLIAVVQQAGQAAVDKQVASVLLFEEERNAPLVLAVKCRVGMQANFMALGQRKVVHQKDACAHDVQIPVADDALHAVHAGCHDAQVTAFGAQAEAIGFTVIIVQIEAVVFRFIIPAA